MRRSRAGASALRISAAWSGEKGTASALLNLLEQGREGQAAGRAVADLPILQGANGNADAPGSLGLADLAYGIAGSRATVLAEKRRQVHARTLGWCLSS